VQGRVDLSLRVGGKPGRGFIIYREYVEKVTCDLQRRKRPPKFEAMMCKSQDLTHRTVSDGVTSGAAGLSARRWLSAWEP
jgi:hypothetical protein